MSRRRLAAQGGLWSGILQWARFGLNTIVFLILARWLSLEEIGAFAVAFAPINILQFVQRTGISETVVQGPADASGFTDTIFWLSLAFGLVMSGCMFGLSFLVGPMMESTASGTYLAAMAVIPTLVGLAAVPEGLLRQRLDIRTLAIRTTASLTVTGLIAIWLGYAGFGGWALVAFAIVNAFLSSVLVIFLVRWTPGGGPRRDEVRKLLPVLLAISGRAFAANSTLPALQLMIGAALGPAAAGAFQIAQRFLSLAATVTVTPLRFATLPVFVQARGDKGRLRRVVNETAGLASLVSAPVYLGLLAVAPVLLPLAVGAENGAGSAPVLQALLLLGGNVGLYAVFTQALTAIGRADAAFHWTFGLFVVNVAIGAITVQHSAAATALGYSLLGYVVAPFVLKTLWSKIDTSPRELSVAAFGPVVAAALMAAIVLFFGNVFADRMSAPVLLAAEIAVGAVVYMGLSLLIAPSQVVTMRSLLVALLPRRP